ncbi:MAG TPA: glycoside hydrolase family 16 protein [Phnomibacter sp.]|nr:glycoside hydrolase family 16 protein [Phnomibacter sp.]
MKRTPSLAIFPALLFFAIGSAVSCERELQHPDREASISLQSSIPASLPGVCDYDLTDVELTTAGWTKIFDEPFSTDLSNWNVWNGGAFNNELQFYQASNLEVSGGTLKITARREAVTGRTHPWDNTPKTFQFTSGRIECKTNVSASKKMPKIRMVARMKLAPGAGMWPAFWSYGDPWPTQGEIDIMEARGDDPFKYSTNYFFGRRANVNLVSNATGYITSATNLQSCWHVYEVIWTNTSLTFMLDGQVVHTNTGGYVSSMFNKTQRITLNLAVGGDYFGPTPLDPNSVQPGTFEVDRVRVFWAK